MAAIFLLAATPPATSPLEKVSVALTIKKLHKNKLVEAQGRIYYRLTDDKMVTHITQPANMLIINNRTGELKTYDIQKNMVNQNRQPEFSSQNTDFYFFLSDRTEYMGLKEKGYTVTDTRVKKDMIITEFAAASKQKTKIKQVKLVHKNYRPIFIGYYNNKGKALQKVYYSQFKTIEDKIIPLKITEKRFLASGDTMMTRKMLSDIKTNEEVSPKYLNYKIPNDAKVVE